MTRTERFRAARHDSRLAVLEGFHPLKHATRFGARLIEIAAREDAPLTELSAELGADVAPTLGTADRVSASEFATLAPHPPATGIIAIAERGRHDVSALLGRTDVAPVVLLENPTRLGNLGAAVRVAAAAEAGGVVTVGEHDPWSPEAIRGAAGLQFALPVGRIDTLPSSPRPVVALAPEGRRLGTVALPPGAIIAFGTERSGLSPEIRSRAALTLAIPMREGVSSLNLATAVAVCLYWWRLAGPPGLLHRR